MMATTIEGYEAHCNDYAVNGDPEADHWRYEENAGYDRWDGCREESDYAAEYDHDEQLAILAFKDFTDHMTGDNYVDCRDIEACLDLDEFEACLDLDEYAA
jgi:hypothetical protein